MNKKNNLLTALLFSNTLLMAACADNGDHDKINPSLMKAASELNKNCPIVIDAETRLDNAVALPNNTFGYNYTLINYSKTDIDTLTAKNTLTPNIKNTIETHPQMKDMRDIDCTFLYTYKDKNGVYTFSIIVKPEDYK